MSSELILYYHELFCGVNWSGVGRARFLCGLRMVKHPLVVGINESIGWKRIKLTMTIRARKNWEFIVKNTEKPTEWVFD